MKYKYFLNLSSILWVLLMSTLGPKIARAVSPYSIFKPLTQAKPAKITTVKLPVDLSRLKFQHEEISLNGIWKYKPDPQATGEKQKWYSVNYDDSSWNEFPIPGQWAVENKAMFNYAGKVWFRYRFNLLLSLREKFTSLRFDGVDYIADVWLNGKYLGNHIGYFAPFEFDVSKVLNYESENLLVVRVDSPLDPGIKIKHPQKEKPEALASLELIASQKTLIKGCFGFWDCRPGNIIDANTCQDGNTGGIWAPVRLISQGNCSINSVLITPRLSDLSAEVEDQRTATIKFNWTITNFSQEQEINLFILIEGKNFQTEPIESSYSLILHPGANRVMVKIPIKNPRLWWPYDHPELGKPDLYSAKSYLIQGKECLDQRQDTFGIRSIRVEDKAFWYLNDKRIYIRGVCYPCSSQWLSQTTEELLEKDSQLLQDAYINFLLVKYHIDVPGFYQLTDEKGLMLWQDFSLLWEYDNSEEFRQAAISQIEEMVYLLYNHPSILLWCCHCEPLDDAKTLDPWLAEAVNKIDQSRPVYECSPTGEHPFKGWYEGNFFDFQTVAEKMLFPNEFGAEAIPFSAKEWMQWPPEPKEMLYHDLRWTLQQCFIGHPDTYNSREEFILASQIYQAACDKYAIETFRRHRYNPNGGQVFFMWNNCWPSATWAVVDYDRTPLLAYDALKTANHPILIYLDWNETIFPPGSEVSVEVSVINDWFKEFKNCKLTWEINQSSRGYVIKGNASIGRKASYLVGSADPITVWPAYANLSAEALAKAEATADKPAPEKGRRVKQGFFSLDIPPDSISEVGMISFTLSESTEIKYYTLQTNLIDGKDHLLARNFYCFVLKPDDYELKEGLN